MLALSFWRGCRQPLPHAGTAVRGAPTQDGALRSLVLIVGLVAGACNYVITAPVLGYENNNLDCGDGIDNDGDGVVDCQDPDCWPNSTLCGEIVPVFADDQHDEDSLALCTDMVDNDGDGQLDCSDRGCQGIAETCCVLEFDDVSCSDHIDNDGNGFADCEDYGCSNGKFVTVCEESTADDCEDGDDNDGDGEVDCDDRDCTGTNPCPGDPENTESRCRDDEDNDGNGYTDCVDRACEGFSFCQDLDTEESMEDCTDGDDNNDNGYVDCEDFSCQRSPEPEVVARCAEILENTFEKCSDGVDNDDNGYPDCEDYSCRNSRDVRVAMACHEGLTGCESAIADACTSNTDCMFPEGSSKQAFTTCLPTGVCGTRGDRCGADTDCDDGSELSTDTCIGAGGCADSRDNDLDGFLDCDDFDCAWDPAVTACADQPRMCE